MIFECFIHVSSFLDNQIYLSQFESDRLEQLKQLELRGNFLTDLSGSYPASLEALYLAENRIKELTLSSADFRRLAVLHLRENYVRKLDGLGRADLPSLRYLNLRKNKITKFRQFRKLARLPKLETLIVLGNPFYGEEEKPGEDDEELGDEEEKEDIARQRRDHASHRVED
ncbi:leucine-rich repeat-containing protein 23-like [Photinus pyralis]|uniref:leucine-rich repeat-containing protein 23-like n=1 Tax=Photinus pyralis TaxID=7054 RepID=UPI0012675E47|nr:leucine-rich repeat-containing protein 23-like [Photinus pyralis]